MLQCLHNNVPICLKICRTWFLSPPHHTTTILRPFFGTTQVSWCQKRTSGIYAARED